MPEGIWGLSAGLPNRQARPVEVRRTADLASRRFRRARPAGGQGPRQELRRTEGSRRSQLSGAARRRACSDRSEWQRQDDDAQCGDRALPRDGGRILVDGVDVTAPPAHKRTIAGLARTFQNVRPSADDRARNCRGRRRARRQCARRRRARHAAPRPRRARLRRAGEPRQRDNPELQLRPSTSYRNRSRVGRQSDGVVAGRARRRPQSEREEGAARSARLHRRPGAHHSDHRS